MTNLTTKLEELMAQHSAAIQKLNEAQTIVIRLEGAVEIVKQLIAAEMEEARKKSS